MFKQPDFKKGDLVRVHEPRACGGLPLGAIGLILEEDSRQPSSPRWTVIWMNRNEVLPGYFMKESVTYGHGIEVISESR